MTEGLSETGPSGRLITPGVIPLFRYWVLGVAILSIISPTEIPYFDRFVIILVYGLFYFYPISRGNGVQSSTGATLRYKGLKPVVLLFILGLQFISVSVSTRYYTGLSLSEAFSNAIYGENSYKNYQQHFVSEGIADKGVLNKIYYIVLLSIGKGSLLIFIANFFLAARRRVIPFLAMTSASLIYLTFGLARGTFFEVFEVFSALIYFWFITSSRKDKSGNIGRSKYSQFLVVLSPVFIVPLFIYNAIRRYSDSQSALPECSPNFCYETWGFPLFLEKPVYMLTVYFGNGAYFISQLFKATVAGGEFLYLIPMYSVFNNDTGQFGVRSFMCSKYVECEFVWSPEMATVISIFGIFSIYAVNYMFSLFEKLEYVLALSPNLYGYMAMYFVFLFALSLPVANFFLVSSSSIVSMAILAALWAVTSRSELLSHRLLFSD